MPNQNQSILQERHLSEMYDAATLAQCDMDWMNTALMDVKTKVTQLKKDLALKNPHIESYFHSLEKILEIYSYVAENRLEYYAFEVERLEEQEKLKGGRNA